MPATRASRCRSLRRFASIVPQLSAAASVSQTRRKRSTNPPDTPVRDQRLEPICQQFERALAVRIDDQQVRRHVGHRRSRACIAGLPPLARRDPIRQAQRPPSSRLVSSQASVPPRSTASHNSSTTLTRPVAASLLDGRRSRTRFAASPLAAARFVLADRPHPRSCLIASVSCTSSISERPPTGLARATRRAPPASPPPRARTTTCRHAVQVGRVTTPPALTTGPIEWRSSLAAGTCDRFRAVGRAAMPCWAITFAHDVDHTATRQLRVDVAIGHRQSWNPNHAPAHRASSRSPSSSRVALPSLEIITARRGRLPAGRPPAPARHRACCRRRRSGCTTSSFQPRSEGCLTVAVAVPTTSPSCIRLYRRSRSLTVRYLPRIRRSSISEQRRSRVNVSGVVTPSPVGVAIENDK